MILPEFTLHQPKSLAETLQIAQEFGGDSDFLAGGSDLLPNYKNRLNPKPHLISLQHVAELRARDVFTIGAMVTLQELIQRPLPDAAFPILPKVSKMIASPLIRTRATVGGNLLANNRCVYFNQSPFWHQAVGLCTKVGGEACKVVTGQKQCYATYCGDLAPVLMVLGATVLLQDRQKERRLPLIELYSGDGSRPHLLQQGELLVRIDIPQASVGLQVAYRKLRLRGSLDFSEAGVAVAARFSGKILSDLRIAVTGLAQAPLAFPEITKEFSGEPASEAMAQEISSRLARFIHPVKNLNFLPAYRKEMVSVFLRQIFREWC
jgi:4-hydroxybenzoyl-CoA reductase subunit beta